MKRVKPEVKRKIAGIVAILLILTIIFSSISVLFIDGVSASEISASIMGGMFI